MSTFCKLAKFVTLASLPAASAFASSPTSIFDSAASPARSIFSLSMLVLSVTLVIFFVVGGLLLYAMIRFRHRSHDSGHEPAQICGSKRIELSWTGIPHPDSGHAFSIHDAHAFVV
jgi:heme/copper-type cytochrome/quinol oxidase subunit 2